ncbi:hypothetical protein GCM10010326_74850 [Streptomyces xanthochromogenes]|uniref:Uncharacterized protein n=1 Tax=Streptomyces xanthochromogenes TaxID=67384 RepID=A0ABQ3AYV1_9ACTN|nr:hypothetical protein GCM10010326_74850 [Streptomyces xanthochromogenes]
MWEVVPQVDQRGHQPVNEYQSVPGATSRRTLPGPTTCLVTPPFDSGLPRAGQLRGQTAQMLPGDTREHLIRENHPVGHDRHDRIMPPTSTENSTAITHQLVSHR